MQKVHAIPLLEEFVLIMKTRDNLLKGAAWNTVENAEYLVKMGLI